MVEIDIRPVERGTPGTGHGRLYAERRFSKEPAQHEHPGVNMPASVAAQVNHHIFDGAVFPGDLPVSIDNQRNCILDYMTG